MEAALAVQVDTAKFSQAMKAYVDNTSKSTESALNGKMRDIMFRACRYTPLGKRAGDVTRLYVRAIAAHRLGNRRGSPDVIRGNYTTAEIEKKMWSILHPARGYMKSAFVKAGRAIKATNASREGEPASVDRSRENRWSTSGRFWRANLARLVSECETKWQGRDDLDAGAKKQIAETALQAAADYVYNDIVAYLTKKLKSHAAAVSAVGGA